MNDQELDDRYLGFANELLSSARQLAFRQGVPVMSESFMQFQTNGSVLHGARSVESYGVVLRFLLREFSAKDPARACFRAHLDAGLLTPPADVPSDSAQAHLHWTMILAEPVIRAVEKLQRLDIESASILETYHNARNAWRGKNIQTQIWIPLLNIEGDLPPTDIGERLRLSKFLPEEKNDLFGRWLNQELITVTAIGRSWYKLSGVSVVDQSEFDALGQRTGAEVERVVTAMRLVRDGSVGAPVVFYDRRPCGLGLFPMALETLKGAPYGASFRGKSEDVPQFQRLFDDLRKINYPEGKSALGTALRRFNLACGRQSEEDKLVDLAIAWESSLLNDTDQELAYKLSLRGSSLLAAASNPLDTSLLLRSGYANRSKIVHAGALVTDPTLVPKCADITREVLKAYVSRTAGGETLQEINQKLDREILMALKRTTGLLDDSGGTT